MTKIVTLAHKVRVNKRIKGGSCPGSPLNKAHTVLTKHPYWTKQLAPKQTTHTALAVAGVTCEVTSKRTCHAGFAYIQWLVEKMG